MSRGQEFDHGTGHKFTMKKEFAGRYNSCCGFMAQAHPHGGWNVWWPGEAHPDETVATLKTAKEIAEQGHNPTKESNPWTSR